jgi:hypothetical protein
MEFKLKLGEKIDFDNCEIQLDKIMCCGVFKDMTTELKYQRYLENNAQPGISVQQTNLLEKKEAYYLTKDITIVSFNRKITFLRFSYLDNCIYANFYIS